MIRADFARYARLGLRVLRRALAALFLAALLLILFAREQAVDQVSWWVMQRIRADSHFDYTHLDLEARLEPDKGTLSATATCHLRVRESVPRRFQLALYESLAIESVSSEVPLAVSRLAHVVYLKPLEKLSPGRGLEVTFTYSGRLDGEISPLGQALVAIFNPFPSWGLRGDGVELNAYNAWYPLPPVEGFYYTWRATLHEPAWSQIICGGVPVAATLENGLRSTEWVSNASTVSLSAMGGAIHPEATPGMPALSFHSRSSSAAFRKSTEETIHDIWAFYAERLGPVPVESQRLVEAPRDRGRSYAVDLISLRRQALTARGEPTHPAAWVRLLAHEMGHLRWGYLVRQDNFAEGIWYEGLTEYSALLYCGHRYGTAALRRSLLGHHWSAAHAQRTRPMARQMNWSSDSSALTYRKSCSVWRMLHYVMGEQAFFALLHEMVETSDQSHTGMAGIRALAEKHHGACLGWFFSYWWYGEGLPDYALQAATWDAGARTLHFTVQAEQARDLDWLLPVEVTGEGRRHTLALAPSELGKPRSLRLEFTPEQVVLDPEVWILDRNRVNNRRWIETSTTPIR